MISIYDLVTKNKNYTNIKNFQLDSHFDEELFLNHFLDPNDKRLDIATILFDKYKGNFPQEIHNIFMWLWKDYSIKIKSFNDLLNLKSSTIEYYYKIIYIVYIQLLLHDLYLNKDAEIKPQLIKDVYNSYYNYNAIEFVPNTITTKKCIAKKT